MKSEEIKKNPMSTETNTVEELATQEYKYGFTTDVEYDTVPKEIGRASCRERV